MRQEKIQFVETVPNKEASRGKSSLVAFLTLLLISVIALFGMVAPYLLAVFAGGLLALLSYPTYQALIRKGVKPKLASLLVTLGVLLLVVAPLSTFVFLIVKQAIAIGQSIGSDGTQTFRSFLDRVSQWGPVRTFIGDPAALEQQTKVWAQTLGKGASGAILSVVSNVPGLLLQLALASIACFFFLLDGKGFLSWSRDRSPLSQEVRNKLSDSFKNTAVSTIWATLAAAAAQTVVMTIGFLALGVPAVALAAGATFVFAWIPLVGSTPVWAAGTIYLYTQGSSLKMVLMLCFGVVAGVVDNFVRPLVLKGRSHMHPLVSLVSIFGGVGVFGILGVFIGPILAAIAISLLEIWPDIGRRFGLIRYDEASCDRCPGS